MTSIEEALRSGAVRLVPTGQALVYAGMTGAASEDDHTAALLALIKGLRADSRDLDRAEVAHGETYENLLALIEERDRLKVERDDLAAMAGGGRRSLAAMFKATFAGRGVEISDDEAERAASRAADLILHAAMAGNPREWCLSCGTVSGDGQCHCTEPFAVAGCNRKARNYVSEMASEATAAEARALAAEAKCDALREALAAEREACAKTAMTCLVEAARFENDDFRLGARAGRAAAAQAIRARALTKETADVGE